MQALRLYAGAAARAHLTTHGLQPTNVSCVPAAAGGPKGLLLGRLDQFLFGHWLPQSQQPIDLVGASIGAWRMATACMSAPAAGFQRLERDYIAQHYVAPPGQKWPSPQQVSASFGATLQAFYDGHVPNVLAHPRYRLHVITSRGQHVLARDGRWRTPAGYAGAFFCNLVHRPALGAWLERVVFSSIDPSTGQAQPLPFSAHGFKTRQLALDDRNFTSALQASCSIPFALEPVTCIPGAPTGCYWDGGITDYHLHLPYQTPPGRAPGLVLYPHFQQAVVPGWLDKALKWRHRATPALDHMLVLAPNPEWVKTLPNGKLPDRTDFARYGADLAGRMKAWNAAVGASQQLADEFAAWLDKPHMGLVGNL